VRALTAAMSGMRAENMNPGTLNPIVLRKRLFAEWLFLLGALLALVSYMAYVQHQEHKQIEALERERLASQAEVIEKNVVPQLLLANRVMEDILHSLPSWRARKDGFKHASHQLLGINGAMRGIRSILVVQADGQVLASSDEKLVGMNFFHQDYFQRAVKNPDPHILHVSAPFKSGSGTFVISLSRAIPGPDGIFSGIVMVGFAPEYFSSLLDSVRHTPDLRTLIVHGEGKIFVTSPSRKAMEGMNLAVPGSFFTRHRDSGQPANIFTGTSYSDGEKRMAAARTIQLAIMDKPLVVGADRNLESIFTPWRKNVLNQAILLAAITVICTMGLWIGQRRRRDHFIERKNAEDNIRAMLKEQRLMFDNTQVGIVMGRRTQLIKCNQRLANMFGYASPKEIEGKTAALFSCSPEQYGEVCH
jgi:PAS domain-containing protein